MTDFLYKLASAIATEEGFFTVGSLPERNNNPGDLRSAPWLQHTVIAHGFWRANSKAEGMAGLYHQLALDISRGWTLTELIYKWAPPSDNNKTDKYISDVAKMVEIRPDVKLWDYLEITKL